MSSEIRERKKGGAVAKRQEQEVAEPDDKKKELGSHVPEEFTISPLFILPIVLATMVMVFMWASYHYDVEGFFAKLQADVRGFVDGMMPRNRYQKN